MNVNKLAKIMIIIFLIFASLIVVEGFIKNKPNNTKVDSDKNDTRLYKDYWISFPNENPTLNQFTVVEYITDDKELVNGLKIKPEYGIFIDKEKFTELFNSNIVNSVDDWDVRVKTSDDSGKKLFKWKSSYEITGVFNRSENNEVSITFLKDNTLLFIIKIYER